MTRINAAIPPVRLSDQHALAEYREIIRVFWLYRKNLPKIEDDKASFIKKIPRKFTLGSGHVLFFIDKLQFIETRFNGLKDNLSERGFKPAITLDLSEIRNTNPDFWKNYIPPDKECENLLKQRITERILNQKNTVKYYQTVMEKEEYLNRILNGKMRSLLPSKKNERIAKP